MIGFVLDFISRLLSKLGADVLSQLVAPKRSNGNYPYAIDELVYSLTVTGTGDAHFRRVMTIIPTKTFDGWVDYVFRTNSSRTPISNGSVTVTINGIDVSGDVQTTSKEFHALSLKVKMPSGLAVSEKVHLDLSLKCNEFFPRDVMEIDNKRNMDGMAVFGYLAMGAHIRLPTKRVLVNLNFFDTYPGGHIKAVVTMSDSEQLLEGEFTRCIIRSKEKSASLSIEKPLMSCDYGFRWSVPAQKEVKKHLV